MIGRTSKMHYDETLVKMHQTHLLPLLLHIIPKHNIIGVQFVEIPDLYLHLYLDRSMAENNIFQVMVANYFVVLCLHFLVPLLCDPILVLSSLIPLVVAEIKIK